jgi:exopolyphosphatase / guanosine-5'-triphosphate,3'-diphosphate pyrophosphatase
MMMYLRIPSPVLVRWTAIAADLARIDGRPPPDALVAMGGAVTNMTAVRLELATHNPGRAQGAVLDRAELDRQMKLGQETFTVSDRGLRHGLLIDRFGT